MLWQFFMEFDLFAPSKIMQLWPHGFVTATVTPRDRRSVMVLFTAHDAYGARRELGLFPVVARDVASLVDWFGSCTMEDLHNLAWGLPVEGWMDEAVQKAA